MEVHFLAVYADVGDMAACRDDFLTQLERGGNAHRLNGGINTAIGRHLHQSFGSLAVGAVDGAGGAKAFGHLQAVVIKIDHDDLCRGIKLSGKKRGQTDRSGSDDRDSASGLNLAIENATLEAGRQNVAEHYQRLFVRAGRYGIEAVVCVRNSDKFGLGAVYRIAENPAAGRAVRIHLLSAIDAFAAGADAGNKHAVAGLEYRDGAADLVDNSDALMAQDAAGLAARQIALEDMKVGATDGRFDDLDDCVCRRSDLRLGAIHKSLLPDSLVDQGFHGGRARLG